MTHELWMQRALELARRAEGQTSPNPMVGAVIVREGRVIGEGFHRRAGQAHAEVEALRAATESPRGATLYVTLEPCCHFGKTPPCSQAVIDAGLAEVYYAIKDPNPRVSGGGHRQLEQAGISVHGGLLEEQARTLNRHFFTYITQKRAYITAKYAMSLDGKIATRTGHSQWITGPAARQVGHRLRQISDAIIVGRGTVCADDPQLTTRLEGEPDPSHPVRVVLDSCGRVPLSARVFDPSLPGVTLLATTERCPESHRTALAARGIDSLVLPDSQGKVELTALTRVLAERNLVRVMVEGGSEVLGAFSDAQLIDEAWAFVGGVVIGGTTAPSPVGGLGIDRLNAAARFQVFETAALGTDVLFKAIRTAQ